MAKVLLSLLGVFILLVVVEAVALRKQYRSEMTRKFIHIVVGVFVAFWPWLFSWRQIQLMAILFLVIIVISRQQTIFKAIHNVDRKTWGELFFAAAIGFTAFIAQDRYIFMAAMLHLSVADGLAAVVGTHYGRLRYRVFGQPKSIVGTLTFLVCSLAIVTTYILLSQHQQAWILLIIPPVATGLENIGIAGSDNLIVPVFVAVTLLATR